MKEKFLNRFDREYINLICINNFNIDNCVSIGDHSQLEIINLYMEYSDDPKDYLYFIHLNNNLLLCYDNYEDIFNNWQDIRENRKEKLKILRNENGDE